MMRKAIQTDGAPKAIGPYSQAVQVPGGRWTFLSGQIPLDPGTGQVVEGDISIQTARVMENLKAVLAAAGLTFAQVVRCTLYLTDLNDFSKVNETYGKYFEAPHPARATIQVAGLPRGAKIEIDAIAVS